MKRSPIKRSKPDPAWLEAREEALCRAEYWPECSQRGLIHECWGGLETHHILPRSHGGTHDLENLVVLCSLGHRYVHEHPAEAYELGLLRRSAA